jgi:hypothetical protein
MADILTFRHAIPEQKMLNTKIISVVAASLLFLMEGAGGSLAQGGKRQVLLTNNSRQSIVEIYASDDGGEDWQADLLGTDFLPPGGSVLVDVDDDNDNCRVNLKTVFDDGSDHINLGLRVCVGDGRAVLVR